MYTQCVLALLTLYVELAQCFSWDIVLGGTNELHFYNNGTLTHSEKISSDNITAITYDAVHNRILYFENYYNPVISSFDIETKKIQTLVRCESPNYDLKFAYDPVTDTLFQIGTDGLYSFSLKPGLHNAVGGKLLIASPVFHGVAVDSCAGYIYWTTNRNIERARFDGSEREVVINSTVNWRKDLTIDRQTQKMYWIDKYYRNTHNYLSIESADLNGKNRKTLYNYRERRSSYGGIITVSKDFIYWRIRLTDTFWQLPKNTLSNITEPIRKSILVNPTAFCYQCDSIAANYKEEDQSPGNLTCEALRSLLPSSLSNVSTDLNQLYDNSTHIIEESDCKCTQGYTGERCNVSICQNYCFQGDCCVSDEQPKCRCNAGYTGERCEVNTCQGYCSNNGVCSLNGSKPVCHCTGDFSGERCDVSVCQNYCIQGSCSLISTGQPKCRCYAGYSGERCEVNPCQGYCLHDGACSMNENNEPVCHCRGDYEGDRCDVSVSVFLIKCFQTVSTFKDILKSDVTPVSLDKGPLQLLSDKI